MELRQYLEVLKRHRWLIVQAVVVVAVVAGVVASMRMPMYRSEAKVLLRPNNPAERIEQTQTPEMFRDLDRHAQGQMDIIRSESVARAAAESLRGADADEIRDKVKVRQHGQSDVLAITATDPDPVRARDMANAVARAYIDNRRENAISSLRQAIEQIEGELLALQDQIAQYDRRIGDGGISTAETAVPENPAEPPAAAGEEQVEAPTALGLDVGGQPTTEEALKAARYAAAVQYQSLYSRHNDLRVDMTLKRGEAELIEEAEASGSPFSPKPLRDGTLGAFVGLLLGAGAAFLREQIDDRARSRDDVEHATGLKVIAGLPEDEVSAREPEHLATRENPKGPLAEATRSLRTSIQFLGIGDGTVRRIVVTSSAPSEGKTLVAANLATAYAQAGYVTVLVSADLRRPRLEKMFGVAAGCPGLTDVVAQLPGDERPGVVRNGPGGPGGRRLERRRNGQSVAIDTTADLDTSENAISGALVSTGTPNLMLLPAGTPPPNPAELLGSRRAGEVLDELGAAADVVIIDTPPVLAVTDAAVLAARADGVLLVCALGKTHRGAAQQSVQVLGAASSRLLGVVLNRVHGNESSYYNYQGYYGTVPDSGGRKRIRGRIGPNLGRRSRAHVPTDEPVAT